MSCVVVWGRGGEREGELKLCKRGGEPSSPAFKVNPGEEDGTSYHQNNVFFFLIIIKIISCHTKHTVPFK